MTFDTHNFPNSSGGASPNTHCPLPGPATQSRHFQISLPSTCSPTAHYPSHLKTSQRIRIPEPPRLYNKRHHQHQLWDHAVPQYYIPLALHRRRPPTHKILEDSRLPFPHRLKYDNTMMLRPCLPLHTYDQRRHSTSPTTTTTTTTTSFTIPISLTLRRSPPPRSPLHSHPSRTWTGRKSVSSSGTSLLNTDIDTNTTLPRVLIPTLPLCSSNVESCGSDPDSSLQLPPIQNEIIRRGSSDLSASLQSHFWDGAGSCSGGSQPQYVETGVGEEGRETDSEGLTQTQMQRGRSGSNSSAMSY